MGEPRKEGVRAEGVDIAQSFGALKKVAVAKLRVFAVGIEVMRRLSVASVEASRVCHQCMHDDVGVIGPWRMNRFEASTSTRVNCSSDLHQG